MSFAKYAVIGDVEYTLEKDPDLKWTFRAPTIDDEINLARFYAEGRAVHTEEGERLVFPWSSIEIAVRQLAMLFGGTNMTGDDGKSPYLTINANIEDREKAIRKFPVPLLQELWKALGATVPGWGPANDKPKNS